MLVRSTEGKWPTAAQLQSGVRQPHKLTTFPSKRARTTSKSVSIVVEGSPDGNALQQFLFFLLLLAWAQGVRLHFLHELVPMIGWGCCCPSEVLQSLIVNCIASRFLRLLLQWSFGVVFRCWGDLWSRRSAHRSLSLRFIKSCLLLNLFSGSHWLLLYWLLCLGLHFLLIVGLFARFLQFLRLLNYFFGGMFPKKERFLNDLGRSIISF